VDEDGSGPCPISGFGVRDVKRPCSGTIVL
jgi:hypothetical protein